MMVVEIVDLEMSNFKNSDNARFISGSLPIKYESHSDYPDEKEVVEKSFSQFCEPEYSGLRVMLPKTRVVINKNGEIVPYQKRIGKQIDNLSI